jgi:hypothetical protein
VALQENGITVLRVGTSSFGESGTAPSVEFLVGSAQVKLVWDTHQGEFNVRTPMWSDGRRGADNPQISDAEWREIFKQAYGIRLSNGW